MKKLSDFIFFNLFAKFFTAWFFSAAIVMTLYPESISLEHTNATVFITVFFAVYILISCIAHKYSGTVQTSLVFAVLIFSMLLLIGGNIYTFLPLAVFYCIIVHHYFNKKKELNTQLPKKQMLFVISICTVFFFSIVTAVSIMRYTTFSAPNFDFGIFVNMFHNMKETFKPIVSCERDKLLSHFAIHFSPALYIFLPVYFIFPSPITVAVCQTAAVYSAIIPFALIMKSKNIPPLNICLMSVVFMSNAALAGSCMYDFHENCLLVPFLMWIFYFHEKKKTPFVFLFAFLTLTIKEDAFIYVAVFAVYIIVSNKKWLKGSALLAISVIYFFAVCFYLEKHGTGIMSYRYDSMISGNDGLFGIIKTIFTNPAHSIKQIFTTTENTPDKLIYFLQMLCPLAFIPFLTKTPSRLILILPIFLNLLTDYVYQYNIMFQYSFGITAFLLYACVLNISNMKKKQCDFISVVAAGLSVMMFFLLFIPNFSNLLYKQLENKEMYEEMDNILESIPDDASVAASTFIVPHLCDRTEIYETYYTVHTDVDYLVFDVRDGYKTDSMKLAAEFEKYGYKPYDTSSPYICIYKKTQ